MGFNRKYLVYNLFDCYGTGSSGCSNNLIHDQVDLELSKCINFGIDYFLNVPCLSKNKIFTSKAVHSYTLKFLR